MTGLILINVAAAALGTAVCVSHVREGNTIKAAISAFVVVLNALIVVFWGLRDDI